jgi:putative two-component system response regulator
MINLAMKQQESMTVKSISKATILIVDDEESVRTMLKRMLEREGYACETAEDAEKAILNLLSHKIDLVISDVRMPGKSGIQLMEEIKQNRPEIATLIMTGLGDKQIADAAISAGSSGYLYKPFQKIQVLASVSHALKARVLDLQNRFEMENLEGVITEKDRGLNAADAKLKKTLESIVKAMSLAIESRDPYTAGHQQRVAKVAAAIAAEMGYSEDQIQNLKMACLIHDIGKISVPAEILCKPGKLSEAEYNIIKDHPRIGYNILKEIEFSYPLADIIHQHHERLDGSGYPFGLKDSQIHLDAKILAVADVVEAMISHRPYRPALGIRIAMDEIISKKGRLYDPEIVDACQKVIEIGDLKLLYELSHD